MTFRSGGWGRSVDSEGQMPQVAPTFLCSPRLLGLPLAGKNQPTESRLHKTIDTAAPKFPTTHTPESPALLLDRRDLKIIEERIMPTAPQTSQARSVSSVGCAPDFRSFN